MDSEFKLVGNLGKDPENTKAGTGVWFSMCVQESRKNKAGGWDKTPHWFMISCFGYAMQTAMSLKKGDKVIVNGSIRTYKDALGKSQYSFNANKIYLIVRPEQMHQQPGLTPEDRAWDNLGKTEYGEPPPFNTEEEIPF